MKHHKNWKCSVEELQAWQQAAVCNCKFQFHITNNNFTSHNLWTFCFDVEVYDPQQKKILHNWEREVIEEGHWAKPMMIFVDGNKEIPTLWRIQWSPSPYSLCTLLSECNFGKLFKQRRIIYEREAQKGQKHYIPVCCYGSTHWRKQGKIQHNKMEVPFVSKSERTNK